jgi:hypothetical protein
MKRIISVIAVIGVTVALTGYWAIPAVAGCSNSGCKVKAPPPNSNSSGQGNSDTQQRACAHANHNEQSDAVTSTPCLL